MRGGWGKTRPLKRGSPRGAWSPEVTTPLGDGVTRGSDGASPSLARARRCWLLVDDREWCATLVTGYN